MYEMNRETFKGKKKNTEHLDLTNTFHVTKRSQATTTAEGR